MFFGISEEFIKEIKKNIYKYSEVKKAVVFGSRALGNYKDGSDVDIALFGKDIDEDILFEIRDTLNEVCILPYFFDIVHYDKITNVELKQHIDEKGIQLI